MIGLKEYLPEVSSDFRLKENQMKMTQAIHSLEQDLGRHYPLVIDGERIRTEERLESVNPANFNEIIGTVSKADHTLLEQAIESSEKAFEEWRKWDPEARAEILLRAAARLRRERFEFSALLIKEAGKPWDEAEGEVAEAIDFLEYYARQMILLKQGKPVKSKDGELNKYIYTPLGISVVIPPWNFPLGILVGTTAASLVTGNTVLLKPSGSTPIIAAKFVELIEKAGLPNGVLNFVPGDPVVVGEYLVDHPKTSIITFTGSREVGTQIYERAAKLAPNQNHLKRTILEMGGKDTVIVDQSADLDIAADAIVVSAFGFSGQKCSAGSRVLIHEDVYEEVIKRVLRLMDDWKVGDPSSFENRMGPVINEKAYTKIVNYINIGRKEGRLIYGGDHDNSVGYFIEPTIFVDLDPDAIIMQEEIFGPVVAFAKFKSFEEAIQIANNTEYALTGAVISNDISNLRYAESEFHVGNLYFNRNCTGAIVGYHPFGGFKMSGTNSKAGGPDYLILYMNAKTISRHL